jgi:hypothetical protein
MQLSYSEGLANHADSESCGVAREANDEALAGEGVRAGYSTSTIRSSGMPKLQGKAEGTPHRGLPRMAFNLPNARGMKRVKRKKTPQRLIRS